MGEVMKARRRMATTHLIRFEKTYFRLGFVAMETCVGGSLPFDRGRLRLVVFDDVPRLLRYGGFLQVSVLLHWLMTFAL